MLLVISFSFELQIGYLSGGGNAIEIIEELDGIPKLAADIEELERFLAEAKIDGV